MKYLYKITFSKERLSQKLGMMRTIINVIASVFMLAGLNSCSEFVEIDPPKNLIISKTIFEDPSTVESALANIFYKIREQGSMTSGSTGLSSTLAIYSDELDYYSFETNTSEFYYHKVTPSNVLLLSWWENTYNLIYASNDIIDGIEGSTQLSEGQKARFKGQALFIRAYSHSLLASIFGDVPYITSTNYLENSSVVRLSVSEVYEFIIRDLLASIAFLEDDNLTGLRILPSKGAAQALLARIYLYRENWEMAETTATHLIEKYSLELDIDKVFLKESSETIWQLKAGQRVRNTNEAIGFIIQVIPGQQFAMTDALLEAFEPEDLRSLHWIGTTSAKDGTQSLSYPYKYKAYVTEPQSLEYSIIFRLSEQYLIRAEARAHLSNLSGSQDDLNKIRNRAGLANTSANSSQSLLDAISRERRTELFTEHGHRWFDLKRTGKAKAFLNDLKPNWRDTDILFPIPESELEVNPHLLPQNQGY